MAEKAELELIVQVTQGIRNIERLEAEFRESMSAIQQAIVRGASPEEFEQLEAAADKAMRSLRDEAKRTGGALHGLKEALDRGTISSAKMAAGFGALKNALGALGIGAFVKGAFDAAVVLESLDAKMRGATGSMEAGAEGMAFASAEAERLGFDLRTVVDNFAGFAAAARGTKLEGEGVRDIFSAVSETSRVLQLRTEEVDGVFRALQQIMSKNKLTAEEMRQQLGDRLPGAFQLMARAVGVTTAELEELIKDGELAADEVLPKFAAELRKTFSPELQTAIDSTAARVQRLNNQMLEFRAAFGSGFADEVATAADEASASMRDAEGAARDLGSGLGEMVNFATKAALGLREVAAVAGILAGGGGLADLGDRTSNLTHVWNGLSAAFADSEASLGGLTMALIRAAGEAQTAGALTGENASQLATFAEALAARYEEAGKTVPAFVERLRASFDTLAESMEAATPPAEDLAETVGNLTTPTEQAEAAARKLTSTLKDEEEQAKKTAAAQRELTDSRPVDEQKRVDTLREQVAAIEAEVAEGHSSLELNEKLAEAKAQLADAEGELASAMYKVDDAAADQEAALRGLTDGTLGVIDAEGNIVTVMEAGAQATDEATQAYAGLNQEAKVVTNLFEKLNKEAPTDALFDLSKVTSDASDEMDGFRARAGDLPPVLDDAGEAMAGAGDEAKTLEERVVELTGKVDQLFGIFASAPAGEALKWMDALETKVRSVIAACEELKACLDSTGE